MDKKIIEDSSLITETLRNMEVDDEVFFLLSMRQSVKVRMSELKLDGVGEWSSSMRRNEGFLLVVRRK